MEWSLCKGLLSSSSCILYLFIWIIFNYDLTLIEISLDCKHCRATCKPNKPKKKKEERKHKYIHIYIYINIYILAFVHAYCPGVLSYFLHRIKINSIAFESDFNFALNLIYHHKPPLLINKVKLILSSFSKGAELWSVNHTSLYKNFEQNMSL